MSKTMWRVIALALAMGVAGCSGGSKTENSPVAPSGGGPAPAAGPWTGTITRPNGLGTLSVQWQANMATFNGVSGLTGPMTIGNGSATVTVTANAITSGNDSNGYTMHLDLSSKAGDSVAFPNCTIGGSTNAPEGHDPFPSPFTTINIPAFGISYGFCRAFIITGYPNSQSDFLQETVQLSMHK
jgi:hypothetical protein